MEPTVGNLTGGIKVKTVKGTLETQLVDAVVVPMIYDDLLFTSAGQTLFDVVGSELIDRFEEEKAGCEVVFGDFVLVENLPGLQCKAVIFLSLIPWNNDPEGVAIDVLRLGINNVLTSCDSMGFSSVAFPVLGVGNALCFPDAFMTDILQEGICAFERARACRKPLDVHIVNYPRKNEKFLWFEEEDEKPSSMFEVEAKVGDVSDSHENLVRGSLMKGNQTPMDTAAKNAQKGATGGLPGGSIHVEVVTGRIETQRVDALVLPMIYDDPLFICAGQTLDKVVLSQLIERFRIENRGCLVELGDLVVMKNLPGLQCKAVIFLSLTPWNDDPEGVAVEVLRLGIKEVLSSCDSRGFGSVAFPALGVDNALSFPDGFMTQVLLEEICALEQNRMSSRRLHVHILNPPRHKEDKSSTVGTRNAPGGKWTSCSKGSVKVKIVQGTLETQEVDAIVSPMVFDHPLSTVVGQSLHKVARPGLMERFREQKADKEVQLGNSVLVEDLPGIQSKLLFFVSLTHWNEDPDGAAVEILRLGISTILAYCDSQRLGSIAFPALGTGKALNFPAEVVAKVMLEEFSAFERDRISSAPMLVRIVLQDSEKQLSQVFKSSQEALKHRVAQQQDTNQGSTPKRVILLGKTGVGKSSLANTLFGEHVFQPDHSANSGTKECKSATRSVDGRTLTLIDTPGLFDTDLSEDELRPKIMNCITECAPGPHAFLILLRVDKYTKQEQEIITQICRNFSEDALKFSVIVFTHGNQLREGMTIMKFVDQKKDLKELVKKCGGRCHVFDNDHWKTNQPNSYRSNAFQREQLLETIDKLVREKKGCHYTNDVLYHVGQAIHREEVRISRQCAGTQPMAPEQITQKAKSIVLQRFLIKLAAATTGALLGAFFGVGAMVKMVLSMLELPAVIATMVPISGFLGIPAAAVGQAALVTAAMGGGVAGGIIGARTALNATEQVENPSEAVRLAICSVMEKRETATDHLSFGPP